MRNVTVTLDEETAKWARIEAARTDQSVSSLIRELLERAKSTHESYPEAMNRYLSRETVELKGSGAYPSREELHARADLR